MGGGIVETADLGGELLDLGTPLGREGFVGEQRLVRFVLGSEALDLGPDGRKALAFCAQALDASLEPGTLVLDVDES